MSGGEAGTNPTPQPLTPEDFNPQQYRCGIL